jgi:hypothetical protein
MPALRRGTLDLLQDGTLDLRRGTLDLLLDGMAHLRDGTRDRDMIVIGLGGASTRRGAGGLG